MMISSTSGIRIRLVALAAITLLALQTLGAGATHRVGHLIDDLTSGAAKALDDAADAASSANKLRPAPGVVAPPVVNKVSPIIGQLPSRPLPALPPPAPRYDVAPALPPINYGGLGEVKIPQVVKQSPPTANLLDPTRKAGDLSPAGAPLPVIVKQDALLPGGPGTFPPNTALNSAPPIPVRPVKVPDLPAQPLAVVKQTPLDQPRNGVKRIVDLTPQQRSPLAQQVSEFSPLDAKFDELFSQFSANVAKRMVDAKARKQRNLRRAGIGGAIFGTAALIAAGGSTPVIMQAIEKKLDNEKVRLLDVENASAGTIEVFEPDDSGALVSLGTVEPGTTHQYTLTGPKTVTIKHSDGTVALVVNVAADTQVQIPA